MLVSFPLVWQNTQENQLVWIFLFWITISGISVNAWLGSVVSVPIERQNIMKKELVEEQICSPHGGHQAKWEPGRDLGPNIPFKVNPQGPNFFLLQHLLKAPPTSSRATTSWPSTHGIWGHLNPNHNMFIVSYSTMSPIALIYCGLTQTYG